MAFTIIVNGTRREVSDGGGTLLAVLREQLGVTGPKFGCGEGACGACTVLIGARAVSACQLPAQEAAGQRVTTAEGLAEDGYLHPVQQAWLETGAMQCGYCTPGWLTATAALLARTPHPDDERIAAELSNICRCCTYPRIRRAVHRAAELMAEPDELEPVPATGPLTAGPGAGQPAPAGPWDRARQEPASFAAAMPDGLMTVVTIDNQPEAGRPGPGSPNDAWVHIGDDGAVTAFTGKVEGGQGTRTALAMLVAEELAVPVTSVTVAMGDTGTSPFDLGTFGSRSMPYAAPPLRAAAAAALRLLTQAAAARFELPPDQLRAANGVIAGPDGAPSVSYGDLLAGQRRVERVPADAAAPAADAAAVLDRLGFRLYGAMAAEVLGVATIEPRGARKEALSRAADGYAACGAVVRRDRVADRLAALGHRGRRAGSGSAAGLRSLTPRELDVARLAARGHTAAEIGRQLFIGTRTVETHLTHVCAKLGVASKRELLRLGGELDRVSEAP